MLWTNNVQCFWWNSLFNLYVIQKTALFERNDNFSTFADLKCNISTVGFHSTQKKQIKLLNVFPWRKILTVDQTAFFNCRLIFKRMYEWWAPALSKLYDLKARSVNCNLTYQKWRFYEVHMVLFTLYAVFVGCNINMLVFYVSDFALWSESALVLVIDQVDFISIRQL